MVKDKNNNNSSNSLVFGRWPQTKTFGDFSVIHTTHYISAQCKDDNFIVQSNLDK